MQTQPELDPRESALSDVKEWAFLLRGDIVLLPNKKSGEPDYDGATRENIKRFSGAFDEIEIGDIARLAILTDSFKRFCDVGNEITTLTIMRDGAPCVRQIGENADPVVTALMDRAIAQEEALQARPRPVRAMRGGKLPWRETPTAKQSTAQPPNAANDNRARFALTWFDDIADSKPKESVIKGVLGKNEFSYIVGMPGAGKSAITTDAACHVAAGLDWFGRRVQPGLVVYVAAERKSLTERRMLAFRKRHGVKDVPLLVVGGRLDLTSNLADASALVAAIKTAEREVDLPCVWVIIDTLTRTFGGGDQNATKDMGKFISACDELLDKTDAHVTVIHHTGWAGDRSKGAIDLDGAVDASFIVKKAGKMFTLSCDGTNDGDEGAICTFAMESVVVGEDEDGEATTAPVIVPAQAPAESLVAAMTGHNSSILEILRDISVLDEIPQFVAVETWRSSVYAKWPDVSPATLRQRFTRAKALLIQAGQIELLGEKVKLVSVT